MADALRRTGTLALAEGIVIDRHHRGAMVLVGERSLAVPEELIVIAERIASAGGSIELSDADHDIVDRLLAAGVLREVRIAPPSTHRVTDPQVEGQGGAAPHAGLYAAAELYELAFSYRDYAAEFAFLAEVHARFCSRPLSSFLELAAGPAGHAIAALERGVFATALDCSSAMADLAKARAGERGLGLDYLVADMTTFISPRRYDLAACLLDSATYLLTHEAMLQHLERVADALGDGGVYILELEHPASIFGLRATTKTEWTVSSPTGELRVSWHDDRTAFDAIRHLSRVTATLEHVARDGTVQRVVDTTDLRPWTAQEIAMLVNMTGRFEVVTWYGALRVDVPFDNQPQAWRMVPVLRKRR